MIEIWGVKGMGSVPFRKEFKSQAALERWLEKNGDNVTIHGTRGEQPQRAADELPERDFWEGDSPDY